MPGKLVARLTEQTQKEVVQSKRISSLPADGHGAGVSDFQAGQRVDGDFLTVIPWAGMVRSACESTEEMIAPHRPQKLQDPGQTDRSGIDDFNHVNWLGVITQQEGAAETRTPGMTLPAHRELKFVELQWAQIHHDVSIKSVSYTHLDVYKRQDQDIVAQIFLRVRALYKKDGGKFPDPILNLSWAYADAAHPPLSQVAMEINGCLLYTSRCV